jgi:UDP-N-acetylglucosamine--N-acetylmuramyl-(pentapeptide) pyrophosphoryl-undecaprenol N-acetylglucosamine transferase
MSQGAKIERVIISGGGTGGHIFPAVAIANEIKARNPQVDILFVGAKGRMEMEKVPAAGYKIIGLDIQGIQRSLTLKNLLVPIKIVKSIFAAIKLMRSFKPQIAVGVGGYASWPTLFAARFTGVPYIIQEQNSYAGISNKNLSVGAKKICVAYDKMETFFPNDKIILTGNPIRSEIISTESKSELSFQKYSFNPTQPIVLVIGGSLGARTLNQAMEAGFDELMKKGIQVLWQTGSFYYKDYKHYSNDQIKVVEFIYDMKAAYSVADIIISRAGALSVSELCVIAKPVILVPSPNVAEDHQTKNAMALVNKGAAWMVKDVDAKVELINKTLELLADKEIQQSMRSALNQLAKPNATKDIVNVIETIIK